MYTVLLSFNVDLKKTVTHSCRSLIWKIQGQKAALLLISRAVSASCYYCMELT